MDQKLGKYFRKLYLCKNQKQYDTYLKKIKHYSSIQVGGNDDVDTNISAYVTDIVNSNYKLITDLDLVKKISYKLEQCKDDFFGEFDPEDTIEYKPGFRFNCFIRPFGVSEESMAKDEAYMFKKNFSLNFTDIYMQKGLKHDDLIIATNFFYYILKYSLDTYIETVIRMKKFGDKTKNLYKNIYLLYKGGNTTRLIFNNFIRSSKKLLENKEGQLITESIKNLDDLIDNYNVGDWDYLIKVNYDDLKKVGFIDDELKKITNELLQVYVYTCSYIKNKIALLLKSNENINITAENIQKLMFSEDTKKNINRFINIYNNSPKKSVTIDSMDVERVYTFDKIIDNGNIKNMGTDDYDTLYKHSFIFKNTDEIKGNATLGYGTMGNYVEVNTPLIDTKSYNIIPESLKKDMVYLSYLSNVGFARRYAISSFNLIRIKVNNVIVFVINKSQPDEREKSMRVNLELVDVSVSNIYDCKGIFNYHYYYPNYVELIDCKIKNPKFKKEKIVVPLPSPHTMFADICHMLFTENQFIWEDPKYPKRIKRLFFLSLPCMYQDGLKTNDIITSYELTKTLFETLTATSTIQTRLSLINGNYEIIQSPYNDNINEKIGNQGTDKFKNIGIIHRIVKIMSTSPYSKCRYLEFLIANYIRMLIMSNYIINNVADPVYYELVQYELQIHRILELQSVYDYLKPTVSTTLTKSLTTLYESTRGTKHSLTEENLVPLGPLPALLPAKNEVVEKFMNTLKAYEKTIIDQSEFTLVILRGFREGKINTIVTTYESDSLF